MGSNVAPTYANIYMNHLETTGIYRTPLFKHCLIWKWYIDDVFVCWAGTEDEFTQFVIDINSINSHITFTSELNAQRVSFLDTIVIRTGNKLETDIYSKPTDKNNLLLYSSFHPEHSKRGLPYSQLVRTKRIVSNPALLETRLDEMTKKFSDRGYDHMLLQTQRSRLSNISRDQLMMPKSKDTAMPRVPFTSPYSKASQKIRKAIMKNWHILQADSNLPVSLHNPPLFSYARSHNLRDSLVSADVGSKKPNSRFLADPKFGTFPCLSNQCNSVIKGHSFLHPHRGNKYRINDYFTCDSTYVVYILKCPCGLLYVGETTRQVKKRISEHKTSIRTALAGGNTNKVPVAKHFKEAGHNVNQLRFQVIDAAAPPRRGGSREKILKQKETKWINILDTISPRGLNEDYELIHFL
ncbi:LOW QUALITY PROTEIN: uncharacterized protein RCH25_043022 [Pelodytes ibericus]